MDLELAGKRVLVTGATAGIGRAIASCFAAEGAQLSICARRPEPLADTLRELREGGATAYGLTTDVTCPDQMTTWVDHSAAELGGIDILVSTVSAQSRDWRASLDTDLLATVSLVNTCRSYLQASTAAAIVFIASQAALLAVPSYQAYPAAKAALLSYAGSLSRELAPQQIRVNCVSPDEVYFEGGIWDRIRVERPEKYDQVLAQNAMGRFCTPIEVARAVVFLTSPMASYISGTNLLVDGANRTHVHF